MATLADILILGLGIVIGFIASVLRDSLNMKNKTNQEFKVKKEQKLEELLNLLETTNKDSFISSSLRATEDSNEKIKIFNKILQWSGYTIPYLDDELNYSQSRRTKWHSVNTTKN